MKRFILLSLFAMIAMVVSANKLEYDKFIGDVRVTKVNMRHYKEVGLKNGFKFSKMLGFSVISFKEKDTTCYIVEVERKVKRGNAINQPIIFKLDDGRIIDLPFMSDSIATTEVYYSQTYKDPLFGGLNTTTRKQTDKNQILHYIMTEEQFQVLSEVKLDKIRIISDKGYIDFNAPYDVIRKDFKRAYEMIKEVQSKNLLEDIHEGL